MTEDLLSKINEGRTASVMRQWLKPVLDGIKEDTIGRMKAVFRSGEYRESTLAAFAAELCALENVENKISAIARAGETASKKMEDQ